MDINGYLKFVLALAFVLGLIGLLALLLRRYGPGAVTVPRRRGQGRRLRIVEVAAVDTRRRLGLVRCDDREHLLLLGANSELLIESRPQENPVQSDVEP